MSSIWEACLAAPAISPSAPRSPAPPPTPPPLRASCVFPNKSGPDPCFCCLLFKRTFPEEDCTSTGRSQTSDLVPNHHEGYRLEFDGDGRERSPSACQLGKRKTAARVGSNCRQVTLRRRSQVSRRWVALHPPALASSPALPSFIAQALVCRGCWKFDYWVPVEAHCLEPDSALFEHTRDILFPAHAPPPVGPAAVGRSFGLPRIISRHASPCLSDHVTPHDLYGREAFHRGGPCNET